MKLISEYAGQKIWFFQPSVWKRYHELKVNEEVIASMQEKGFFGMKWDVSINGKNWEIYRKSCWRSAMSVREAGYEMPLAELTKEGFRNKWLLNLPQGERLRILPHLFKNFCEIKNEMEEQLIKIKPKAAFKDRAEVTVEKKSDVIDKYPWTVVLAYIIIVQLKHQAAHSAH